MTNKKFMDFCVEHKDSICRKVNSIPKSLKALSLANKGEIVSEDGKMAINGSRISFLSSSIHKINNEDTIAQLLGDMWTDIDFQNTQNEGGKGNSLPAGKKPEMLIKRIIEMASEENDLVLDAYSGSGTTAAVALKTNRRFIAIEQLNKHYDISVDRLKKVLEGEPSGISKLVGWEGGGDFVSVKLKELSQEIIDKITVSNNKNELINIFNDLIENPFVTYKVEFLKMKENKNKFENLSIKIMKEILFSIIDKNNLYVNYSDSLDHSYDIDSFDILFSDTFYESGTTK